MMRRQITVGFDNEVNVNDVAKVLEEKFGKALIGKGIIENGIPQGYIYISNPKRKKK
jgi:hypothetical protein